MSKHIVFILPSTTSRWARAGVLFRPRVEELEPRWAPAGGFGPPVNYMVGQQPVGLAAVDFLPFSPVHLVVANGGSPSFTFLQNQGDGTFLGHTVTTGAPLTGLAVAPWPGDGAGPPCNPVQTQGTTVPGGATGGTINPDNGEINCVNSVNPAFRIMPACICDQPIALDRLGELILAATASQQVLSYGYNRTSHGFDAIGNFATPAPPVGAIQGLLSGPGTATDVITVNHGSSSGQLGSVSVLRSKGGGRYQAPQNFAVGNTPYAEAVGDFDGDGTLDIAAVNLSSNTVSILLGNGDGSFRPAVDYAVGMHPVSVAVGDFNGDGNLDLAVTNEFSNTVSVLRGNGDGTFQPPVNFTAGNAPAFMAVGDFNGDGNLDLAVGNVNGNNVSILLGNGDGTFRPAVNYAVGTTPQSVAVGDFNGDGVLDLAVANINSSNVSILLGNGDGTFRPAVNYAAGNNPHAMALGDFNGDGNLDLAVTNELSGTVSILLGNGNGSFQAPHSYAVGPLPYSVAAGDFNNDGIPDLAVTTLSNGVDVLLGNGDGTFQSAVLYAAGVGSDAVAVGDFTGAGILGLAVANSTSNDVSVLLGNGNGTFVEAPTYPVGHDPATAVLGDFNRDGIPDLAVTNYGDDTVSVLLGNGDGTFRNAVSYSTGTGSKPVALGVASLNGDGILDIVTANYGTNDVSVLLGNGDGTFQAPLFFSVGDDSGAKPTGIALAPYKGDGLPDLAVSLKGDNSVAILENLGAWYGPGPGAPGQFGRVRHAGRTHDPLLDAFRQSFGDRPPWESPIVPGQGQGEPLERLGILLGFDFAGTAGQRASTNAPALSGTRYRHLIQPGLPGSGLASPEHLIDLLLQEWLTFGFAVPGMGSDLE